MKTLFITTAFIESVTGLILLISPSYLSLILVRASVDSAAGMLLGRIAGAALLSLGVACWLAHKDEKSRAATGIAVAILLYNMVAVFVLAYAGLNADLLELSLWAVVVIHLAMAVWCTKVFVERDHTKKTDA